MPILISVFYATSWADVHFIVNIFVKLLRKIVQQFLLFLQAQIDNLLIK